VIAHCWGRLWDSTPSCSSGREAVAGWQAQRVSLLLNRLQHLADEMAWLFLTWLPPRALSRTCLCSPHGLHALGLQVMRAVLV